MKPYLVTIYPQTRTDYVSELYAGLFELSAAGDVVLRFSRQQAPRVRESGSPVVLRIDVKARGARRPLKVCFDTGDWRTIASMDDLRTADVYFKRSYHAPYIRQLDPSLQHKVVPMGLHYACSSRNESLVHILCAAFAREVASGALTTAPLRAMARVVGNPIRRALTGRGLPDRMQPPMYIEEFEVEPQVQAQAKIFYRTRVYGPKDAPENFRLGRMDEVNDLRVKTVRALKARFGDRFIGGLRASVYAKATYPDCMFPGDPGLRGHVELSRACLININTAGLHDSTSWKMPEYMAGSRCIVSEPTVYETPEPLVEGLHYLPFSSPEECVAACERLLGDVELVRTMRTENFAYYSAHIRPDRLMSRCLQTALEVASERAGERCHIDISVK